MTLAEMLGKQTDYNYYLSTNTYAMPLFSITFIVKE